MRNNNSEHDEPYLPNDSDSSHHDPEYTQDYYDEETSHRKVGKWTPEEDKLLRKYVPMYGEKQWRKISEHIPGRSSIQCLHRWTKILKPGLVKGPWTAEEDQRLMTWVRTEGPTKWAQAANFIQGRSGKQCRERWFNNLNPNVKKGNWAKEEDELIYELYQKYGTSWSKIAKFIQGRTENAIKNRFYSTLRKLAADQRKAKDDLQVVGTESQKTDTVDEAYEPVIQAASPNEAFTVEPPNMLYKLLQDKVQPVEGGEGLLKAEMVKPMKEVVFHEEDESGKKQTSNFITPKKGAMEQQEAAKKTVRPVVGFKPVPVLAEIEFEDNNWAFEKFLLSLDGETNPSEFLGKEPVASVRHEISRHEIGDTVKFDVLQQKILNYCQDNILSLSEAFKTMTSSTGKSDISPVTSDVKTTSRARTVTQILPMQASSGFKVESGNGGFYQENIKGIRISAPMPVTRISFNNKENIPGNLSSPATKDQFGGNMAGFMKHEDDCGGQGYAMMPQMQSNKSSPAKGYESPQIHNLDLFGQSLNSGSDIFLSATPVKNKGQLQKNFEWDGFNQAHQNRLTNLMEVPHQQVGREGEENDSKMNFLFQQLYSLEELLANARTELIKLEGTLNEDEDNKENVGKGMIKMKEEKTGKRLEGYNEVFASPEDDLEQIVKKRKHL